MTVQNYTPLSVTPGAGVLPAPIAIPSPFFKDADVRVYFIDNRAAAIVTEILLVKDTDYTITKTFIPGATSPRYTGSVSIIAAVPVLCDIVVFLDPADEQTDALSARPFRPDDYERALDYAAMRDAALRQRIMRAVRSRLSVSAPDLVFPAPADGYMIGWNGQYLTNIDPAEFVALALQGTLLIEAIQLILPSLPVDPPATAWKLWNNGGTISFTTP